MANYFKYGIVVAVVATIYLIGYKHAQTEGERAIEALKLESARAVIEAQEKEKAKYEKAVADLVSRLNGLRSEYDNRLYELDRFRNANTDLEACRRQRSDLAELAVEGEKLLNEASVYLNGGSK
jgi:hypothetical protein